MLCRVIWVFNCACVVVVFFKCMEWEVIMLSMVPRVDMLLMIRTYIYIHAVTYISIPYTVKKLWWYP